MKPLGVEDGGELAIGGRDGGQTRDLLGREDELLAGGGLLSARADGGDGEVVREQGREDGIDECLGVLVGDRRLRGAAGQGDGLLPQGPVRA